MPLPEGEPRVGRRGCPPTDRLDGEVSADAVAALADDLDAPDRVQVLVIDDFHLAGQASADTPRWLVEYHMPSLQLVVASRVDPPLRVHRMRGTPGSGRTAGRDLAFSVEETRSLLAGFGVLLDEPELALVHRRSEGSVAGLQMAALSIQGSPDHATAAGRGVREPVLEPVAGGHDDHVIGACSQVSCRRAGGSLTGLPVGGRDRAQSGERSRLTEPGPPGSAERSGGHMPGRPAGAIRRPDRSGRCNRRRVRRGRAGNQRRCLGRPGRS